MTSTMNDTGSMYLEDDIGEDRHAELDKAILRDQSFALYFELNREPPCRLILRSIVWNCDKLDRQYAIQDVAAVFLQDHPEVEQVIQNAWKLKTFKAVRLLRILRKPSPTHTSPRRLSGEETEDLVANFLTGYDKLLDAYLSRPHWSRFWEIDSTDPNAPFINGLKIPQICGVPNLLMHNIGGSVVDRAIVDELFRGSSKFLVNTSGSGKTRLLVEGLSKHWGIYLTAQVDTAQDPLGSADVMYAIKQAIPKSNGFTADPETLDEASKDDAFERNRSITTRRFHQILMARLAILERFLKMAQSKYPDRSLDDFRNHWLHLQLFPTEILSNDIFSKLTEALAGADESYLGLFATKIRELQSRFGLDESFVCVLDEAQIMMKTLETAFRSKGNKAIKRPVLGPIIDAWQSTRFTMIVSGTGLSIDVVNNTVASSVAKGSNFTLTTNTGAFDDPEGQRKYIERYIPKYILETESGKRLVARLWAWLRGRHRFTATFLFNLLNASFSTPHRIFDIYVRKMCQFTPTDGVPFVSEEALPSITIVSQPFDFEIINTSPELAAALSDAVTTWMVQMKPLPFLTGSMREKLVECGFGRFLDKAGYLAVVDEPLVLLAGAHALRELPSHSIERRARDKLLHPEGRREHFEQYLALCLASAFGDGCTLSKVFKFPSPAPHWASQNARLVSIDWSDEKIRADHFDLRQSLGSTPSIGCKCDRIEDTVKWFEAPSSAMCFPDTSMGPDLVCFLKLECGVVITVALQSKCFTSKRLPADVQLLKGIATVNPLKFYSHPNYEDAKWDAGRVSILNTFERLKALTPDTNTSQWYECFDDNSSTRPTRRSVQVDNTRSDIPLLSAIASSPAMPRDGIRGCAILNTEHCLSALNIWGSGDMDVVDALAQGISIKYKRGPDGSVDDREMKRHHG